ncbi:MAG TPA: toll/interleukin-1 receptor domain-containing protein [Vicinamibacterales bacterium]
MKIFLSYASEQAAIAESIEVALSGEGHDVFRDRSDLPSGEVYHARIREAIAESDLFIFLITPEAVSAGRYTLTELELAQQKWPNPSGHVLPVVVARAPREAIPRYLSGVTYLAPSGNVPASVAAAVANLGRPRRRLTRPFVAALAIAVVVAAAFTIRWAVERSRLQREVSGLTSSAKVQVDGGAYASAWDLYAKAAALVPENNDVRRARERLAMDWLENVHLRNEIKATVENVSPVLARCVAGGEVPRAADCQAHLGWADMLRASDGVVGADPISQYQRALKIDPNNVYAHAMWGYELRRDARAIAEARAHFEAALASGRERSFVRLMQLSALLSGMNESVENEAVRVVNDMRIKGEAIPGASTTATAPAVEKFWSVYYSRVFNGYDRESFLAAIPAADHVATFGWLFTEGQISPDRKKLRLYILAALQEHAGAPAEALANYQAVRDALVRDGSLAYGGRLPDGTLAAIKRLSKK